MINPRLGQRRKHDAGPQCTDSDDSRARPSLSRGGGFGTTAADDVPRMGATSVRLVGRSPGLVQSIWDIYVTMMSKRAAP